MVTIGTELLGQVRRFGLSSATHDDFHFGPALVASHGFSHLMKDGTNGITAQPI